MSPGISIKVFRTHLEVGWVCDRVFISGLGNNHCDWATRVNGTYVSWVRTCLNTWIWFTTDKLHQSLKIVPFPHLSCLPESPQSTSMCSNSRPPGWSRACNSATAFWPLSSEREPRRTCLVAFVISWAASSKPIPPFAVNWLGGSVKLRCVWDTSCD